MIKNTYLRRVQAPQGVKPTLKAWMELSWNNQAKMVSEVRS